MIKRCPRPGCGGTLLSVEHDERPVCLLCGRTEGEQPVIASPELIKMGGRGVPSADFKYARGKRHYRKGGNK